MTVIVTMEAVVAVAIGVLATIFLASMVALIVVCSHRFCCRMNHMTKQQQESQPDVNLVDNMEGIAEHTDVELDEVGMNAQLEQILQDDAWVNDATGLAPHCLAILKICHHLTEKLVGMTMGNAQELISPETLSDIVATAKRISPRVDDVVMSMYPPLDPRLLEARCSALVLAVRHLVFICKNVCRFSGVLDFVNQSLAEVEDNLKVLQEASMMYESQHPLARLPPDECCQLPEGCRLSNGYPSTLSLASQLQAKQPSVQNIPATTTATSNQSSQV